MELLAELARTSTEAPRAFFARWIDHDTWPQWSPGTQWARVEGEVRLGARGILKPVGAPKSAFVISEYERDRVYTDRGAFPGATLTIRHTVQPEAHGSRLNVRVWLEGPLAWFWARTALKGLGAAVTDDLDRLIGIVENPA